jgi:hypothetical protein
MNLALHPAPASSRLARRLRLLACLLHVPAQVASTHLQATFFHVHHRRREVCACWKAVVRPLELDELWNIKTLSSAIYWNYLLILQTKHNKIEKHDQYVTYNHIPIQPQVLQDSYDFDWKEF